MKIQTDMWKAMVGAAVVIAALASAMPVSAQTSGKQKQPAAVIFDPNAPVASRKHTDAVPKNGKAAAARSNKGATAAVATPQPVAAPAAKKSKAETPRAKTASTSTVTGTSGRKNPAGTDKGNGKATVAGKSRSAARSGGTRVAAKAPGPKTSEADADPAPAKTAAEGSAANPAAGASDAKPTAEVVAEEPEPAPVNTGAYVFTADESNRLKSQIESALRQEPALARSAGTIAVNVTPQGIELTGSAATGKDRMIAQRLAQSYAVNVRVTEKIKVLGHESASRRGSGEASNMTRPTDYGAAPTPAAAIAAGQTKSTPTPATTTPGTAVTTPSQKITDPTRGTPKTPQ